ncbi:hypothetical protein MLD38_030022 [Melastoma candidum]|uniref:Uncharacterized protein n=2 Tax=Melastoma candidum TaxID=119954 RepID=A0ACB9MKP8_9MYRT|nr:hypothetical protein MLD38_030022 [Melastoma candidum]
MTTLQQCPHIPDLAAAAAVTSPSSARINRHSKSNGRRPLRPVNSNRSGTNVEAATPAGKGITNAKLVKPLLAGSEFGKENENRRGTRGGCEAKASMVKEMEEEQGMGSAFSLEEELMAVRKKMERMRVDRERTERLLDERLAMLDAKIRELDEMGEVQKLLEMEVDRLYRLKQLKSTFASKVAPMKSLREMEQNRKSEAGSESASWEVKLEESPRSSVASAKSISTE